MFIIQLGESKYLGESVYLATPAADARQEAKKEKQNNENPQKMYHHIQHRVPQRGDYTKMMMMIPTRNQTHMYTYI